MKKRKTLVSALLVLALLCAALPASAAGSGSGAWDGKTIDVSWYNKTDTEFTISTPAQLMGLAAIVNGIYNADITQVIGDPSCIGDNVSNTDGSGANGSNQSTDTYHYGMDDFKGKTIYLAADLDMGGVYDPATGVWSGPRYMPIGGQYLMESEDTATKLSSSFCGTLDGQGHYILNIYCPRHCSASYGDGQSIGLIGRLGTHDNDPEESRPDSPRVANLAITGYIEGNRSVGGIVGKTGRSREGVVIENCANYATVKNTDAKGCGGIAGAGWNLGAIRNCFNAGMIMTTYSCPTGGISGSNEITLENCYNVGTISAPQDSYAMAIGTNNGGGADVSNCYWLTGSAPGGGYYGHAQGTVAERSAAELKAVAAKLGGSFAADSAGINNGYPILTWQAQSAVRPLDAPPAPASAGEKASTTYVDVAESAWYAAAVNYVTENGLFDPASEGSFAPDAPMTRLMLAEALYRLIGSPAVGRESPFPDCQEPSAIWAYEEGVVSGMGDGSFAPNDSITREQIATMLLRYAGILRPNSTRGDLSAFPDAAFISSWAVDAASWAVGEGLINGDGAGNFAPQGDASRAQVAQILLNFAG